MSCRCAHNSRGLKKKKKSAGVITSSRLPPQVSLPQHPRRHDLRAAPGSMQGKHVLTAMQTLSRSEPGKADSALAGGVDQGCRGASSGWTGVPREGSPQCTRTNKTQCHNFPSRSCRLPGFAGRCGVGVSWSWRGRRRSHRAGSVLR